MVDDIRDRGSKARILAAQIEEAFQGIPYPGDNDLVTQGEGCDPERSEIASAFAGKLWRDLSLPFLRYHHESLFFFSPAAYRFFLPAYLLACVLSYEKAGNITNSVVFSLTLPNGFGAKRDRFLERMNGLSASQKRTITNFLYFFLEEHSGDFPNHELESVLRGYWNRT
jgi:hypothetical protein